jgi:hypothetical protein
MIAAALVPPIGVIGIGIAWGLPSVVVGSGVLLVLNLVSINLAALAVFWYQGYRPEQWFRADDARATTFKRAGVLLAVVVLLSVVLGAITYGSIQSARAEREIKDTQLREPLKPRPMGTGASGYSRRGSNGIGECSPAGHAGSSSPSVSLRWTFQRGWAGGSIGRSTAPPAGTFPSRSAISSSGTRGSRQRGGRRL